MPVLRNKFNNVSYDKRRFDSVLVNEMSSECRNITTMIAAYVNKNSVFKRFRNYSSIMFSNTNFKTTHDSANHPSTILFKDRRNRHSSLKIERNDFVKTFRFGRSVPYDWLADSFTEAVTAVISDYVNEHLFNDLDSRHIKVEFDSFELTLKEDSKYEYDITFNHLVIPVYSDHTLQLMIAKYTFDKFTIITNTNSSYEFLEQNRLVYTDELIGRFNHMSKLRSIVINYLIEGDHYNRLKRCKSKRYFTDDAMRKLIKQISGTARDMKVNIRHKSIMKLIIASTLNQLMHEEAYRIAKASLQGINVSDNPSLDSQALYDYVLTDKFVDLNHSSSFTSIDFSDADSNDIKLFKRRVIINPINNKKLSLTNFDRIYLNDDLMLRRMTDHYSSIMKLS